MKIQNHNDSKLGDSLKKWKTFTWNYCAMVCAPQVTIVHWLTGSQFAWQMIYNYSSNFGPQKLLKLVYFSIEPQHLVLENRIYVLYLS